MAADVRRLFVIGAQRCGTTHLHRLLDAHPDVVMNHPVRPEPKHFLEPGSEATDIESYDRRYFPGRRAPVHGEKSTTYLERPDAAGRIRHCFPHATFVVVVRDPIDRALSNYWFSVRNGLEDLPPAAALAPEAEERPWDEAAMSASPYHYLRRGRYADALESWSEHVPRESMVVVTFEEVVRADLRSICDHLGIAPVQRDDEAAPEAPTDPARDADHEVCRRLTDYFEDANRRLASEWGVDTSSWGGTG